MTICSNGHMEIDYDGRYSRCPLCKALDDLAAELNAIREITEFLEKENIKLDEKEFLYFPVGDSIRKEIKMNRFKDNGDGTITDTKTGLMWQKNTAGEFTWEEALKYCEDLKLAGYSDWRLPDKDELSSLVDKTKFNPTIDVVYFPNTRSSVYWSSSADSSSTLIAWGVYFRNGYVSYYGKYHYYPVRAVRGGQKKG